MKLFAPSLSRLALALLCLSLAGCRTPHKTTHLSNGYEEVAYHFRAPLNSDEPPPVRVSFQYMGPDGKLTRIWPSLYGAKEIIHGDIAIFVGDKTYIDAGSPALHPRLFAVKAPQLPLDITDDVLLLWAKTAGKNFKKAEQQFNGITPQAVNGGLWLHLDFSAGDYLVVEKDIPDKADLHLSWDQVLDIMHNVNMNGFLMNDLGWKTPYIGEKF